jgi:hypothetical protein
VSLHSTGENQYAGTAKSGAQEYDLTVEVTRTRINLKAEGRPQKLTKERVEQNLAKNLKLSSVTLEEKTPERFEGPGVTETGEKLQFEVVVRGAEYSVKWKDKEDKPRSIQMTITEGNVSSRIMSYSP